MGNQSGQRGGHGFDIAGLQQTQYIVVILCIIRNSVKLLSLKPLVNRKQSNEQAQYK